MPKLEKYKHIHDRCGSSDDENHDESAALLRELADVFSTDVVNELRRETGYNPRQRVATAYRLLHACVEACLCGKTLGFASIRAFFVKRFGPIRPRAFQLRFKSTQAVAFFRAALDRIVDKVATEYSPSLTASMSDFDDVMVYDGTGQRVPARGRKNALKGCSEGTAASKWVIGYSLKNGIAVEAFAGEGTSAEIPMWKKLVPRLRSNVLYLLDLGFYCRYVYEQAQERGAHVLMRLKADEKNLREKLRVVDAIEHGKLAKLRTQHTVASYIRRAYALKHDRIDINVHWGMGKTRLSLRVVGVRRYGGWFLYLTTLTRDQMDVATITEAYRMRWLIEFLFREWKQEADWGRSATADRNALEALTYAALITHALVRSLRIAAALRSECSLADIRPLATLHVVRSYSSELITALLRGAEYWKTVTTQLLRTIRILAYEPKSSKARQRIACQLGALGG